MPLLSLSSVTSLERQDTCDSVFPPLSTEPYIKQMVGMHDLTFSQLQNGVQAGVTVDSSLNEFFVSAWQIYLWLALRVEV